MSVYRVVSIPGADDDDVDLYGADVGDLVEIADPTPYNDILLKGSKVFSEEWRDYGRLCVADTLDDLLKYVEEA